MIPHRRPYNQDDAIDYLREIGVSPNQISDLSYLAANIDRGGYGKKINAIKDLRSFANLGLKEAKEVIDCITIPVNVSDIQPAGVSVTGYFYSLDGGTTWEHSFTQPLVRVAVLGADIKPEKVVVPSP